MLPPRSQPRSANQPTTKAAAAKPSRYPPVGPLTTAQPPLPPLNTGIPQAPTTQYPATLPTASRLPSDAPRKRTANVWPVTGTGVKGRGKRTCADSESNAAPDSHECRL